ncbi:MULTISPECIES: GAF domain-containing protein [unclassified Streptomyces]|uniref:GAF domain-containing protein n=1 Tax=unclassified Streptomyces TaxID=2593676 RepID=UPI002E81A997|nr:GAF domain-containing protein [Streptomyces sp. NBC_00589]WTI42520.1 GAF domain-containing protein [Streptomyces sp. NBC_00775]WUB33259.1 GAF domain-containing protein [Streptomyces sp. NBC_00589]
MDASETVRHLQETWAATLRGERSPIAPRPVIGQSWQRVKRFGVDPEQGTDSVLLQTDELEHRRTSTALAEVMPILSGGLGSVADASLQIMVVTDPEGRVLWREGNAGVLRRADTICLEEGAAWSEDTTGTNAIGTALSAGAAVQVHSAEHFVRTLHDWTCAAAPVHDPRDGRLLGIIDVSGPDSTFHPATLALVDSVSRLAESELRSRHLTAIERLRAVAAPLLCRLGGKALVVDLNGWLAAVTGMPPVDRVPLPSSFGAGRVWLPSLGMCVAEPMPGGWLLRVTETDTSGSASRVVLDLSEPRRPCATVAGAAGSWAQDLTPRHAELLYVLAVHRQGRSAAQLAVDLFGDPTRTVTVRAELSRVRRRFTGLLDHRPYRFREEVEVEVLLPDDPLDLLPHSTAPAVLGARAGGAPWQGQGLS